MCNKKCFGKLSVCFPILSLLLLSSCSNLFNNVEVKNYLKEYTESAAVVAYALDSTYPTDSEGYTCIPSGADHTITLTLRNPQQYALNVGYILSGSADIEAKKLTSPIITEQQGDTSVVKITLADKFLKAMDGGDGDITMTVTLTEPKSQRTFSTYTIPLHANTPPPAVTDAVVCQDSSGWVVCFNMPGTGETAGIHRDIQKVTINGTEYPLTITSGTVMFNGTGAKPKSAAPDGFAANPNTGLGFNPASSPAAGQPFYFSTGDNINENKNRIYTVTVTDTKGLSSTAYVSAAALQLGAVTGTGLAVSPAVNTVAQNSDGTGSITLCAPEKTQEQKNGNQVIAESIPYDRSGVSIIYKIYTGSGYTTLYAGGTISGTSGTITIPAGTSRITAFARKSLFADSVPTVYNCSVVRTRVYVSSAGDDSTGTGDSAAPVATINKAVGLLDTPSSDANYIYVLSDLAAKTDSSGDFITINRSGLKVTIMGSDTSCNAVQRTIKANRSATNTGRVITITSADTVTLQSLTVTGGYMTDGGGIYIAGGTINLNSGTKITGNTAAHGAGVYTKHGLSMMGSAVIDTRNDVYLENSNITVDSTLTGSGTVARITLPDSVYQDISNKPVLVTGTLTQDICSRFAVTPNNSQNYIVLYDSSSGKGVLGQIGASVPLDFGSYVFHISKTGGGTDASSFTRGNTIYWYIQSNGSTVCSDTAAYAGALSTLISLRSNGSETAVTADGTGTAKTGTVTIPSVLPAGSYRVYLKAVISGSTYAGYIPITVTE